MHPSITYELRVTFDKNDQTHKAAKQRLIDWLLLTGVESFVEGALDVDYNHEYGEPERDFYKEFGGDDAPLSIYRYSRESLDDLRVKLEQAFKGSNLTVDLHTMPTDEWMEGWKESFKPFTTDTFYVRPPWDKDPAPKGLLTITIEPGMAFGTGQHATTRLCLEELGKLYRQDGKERAATKTVLDVGTGTGILAIGARLLGYGQCAGTDIDDDAIMAASENCKMNQADIYLAKGSVPEGQFDLVFANILAVVLLRIMDRLAGVVAPGGHLCLSGILVEEEHELAAKAAEFGLEAVTQNRQDGWSCLVVRKPA